MTTPVSIVRFSQAMLASIALSVVQMALNFDNQREILARNPQTAGLGDGFVIATLGFGFAIFLLLWFFIARRASNIAKWVLVVLTVIGLFWLPGTLRDALAASPFSLGLVVAVLVLQLFALGFLFRPDARDWLAGKAPADPDTFD